MSVDDGRDCPYGLLVLQVVIDLPKRLKIARTEQAFGIAVDSYCEAAPLLKKYGHQGALRAVASDSKQEIKEIAHELEKRLMDPDVDPEECVKLLSRVDHNPDDLQVRVLLLWRQSSIVYGTLGLAGWFARHFKHCACTGGKIPSWPKKARREGIGGGREGC